MSIARANNCYTIIGICGFSIVVIATIQDGDPENLGAALAMLTITTTAFGLLASNTALNDIYRLISDLDEEITQNTHFGRVFRNRTIGSLTLASTALIWLTGLAGLTAILPEEPRDQDPASLSRSIVCADRAQ